MTSGVQPAHPVRLWEFATYEVPSLIVLLALGWITILSLTHPGILSLTHSGVLGTVISTASLLIALGAAYVALTEFLLYGALSSFCIGLAFLLFGGGHIGMRLVPLLMGWESQVNWTPYGWGIEDAVAGALLLAAGVVVDRVVPLARRARVLGTGVLCVFLIAVFVAGWVYGAGNRSVPGAARAFSPLLSALLFFGASVLFWKESKRSHRPWYVWLSSSLVLAGFAQFQYAIHQYPVNVVQTGDVLRLMFFSGILVALAAEWSHNYRRWRWQARELTALQSLASAPNIHDVSSVIEHIQRVAHETLHARARVLMAERDIRHLLNPWELDSAMRHGESMDAHDSPPGGAARSDNDLAGQVTIGVPLQSAERRLGMLVVSRSNGEDFGTYDVRLVQAFGSQASTLLERSLLYEEIAAGAVLQERSRLAREIHDGLSQHLAFLKMRVAWLKRSRALEAPELGDIEEVLETALIEARHAITTLRSEPEGTSTVEAIAQYAEEFAQVSELNVDVQIDRNVTDVGPKVRVELLRIIQEGLNNIRKHARASHIDVQIAGVDGGLRVRLTDNGSGFDLGHSEQGHFGLEIMKERAESVDGQFTVSSTPNVGTEVCVWVPARELETGTSHS